MKHVLHPYELVRFKHPLLVEDVCSKGEVFLDVGAIVLVITSMDEGDALQRFIGLYGGRMLRIDAFPVELTVIS